MNYDSKKTLSENVHTTEKKLIDNRPLIKKRFLNEGRCEDAGYFIPVGMAEIMRFQHWVFEVLEKDAKIVGSKKWSDGASYNTYNSILCSSPCIYKEAVDGAFGSSPTAKTYSAWQKYGETYKKTFPDWCIPQNKFTYMATGVDRPLQGMTQIKNFQKWFLEHYEKNLDPTKTPTVLCGNKTCCKEGVGCAIDGSWGAGTEAAWKHTIQPITIKTWDPITQKYVQKGLTDWWYGKPAGDAYTKLNPNWGEQITWDFVEEKKKEEQKKEINATLQMASTLKNIKNFMNDPSGWDGVAVRDPINPRYQDWNNSTYWKTNPKDVFLREGYGWDYDVSTYPMPKKYTSEEMGIFYVTKTDGKEQGKKIDPNVASTTAVYNTYDPLQKSDNDWMKLNPEEASKMEVWRAMNKFNNDLDKQKTRIDGVCKPIRVGVDGSKTKNGKGYNKWISPHDICITAGGLWAYEKDGVTSCGCRDMAAPSINGPGSQGTMIWSTGEGIETFFSMPSAVSLLEYKTKINTLFVKPVSEYSFKDYATIVSEVTMPLTFATMILFPAFGVSKLTTDLVLLSYDLIDAAAYMVLGNDYGVGLSLTMAVIGAPNLINKIPAIRAFTDGTNAAKTKQFIKEFSEALIEKSPKLATIYKNVCDELWANTAWIKMMVSSRAPKLVKGAKVVAKVSKSVINISKFSGQKMLDFTKFLLTTDKSGWAFFRNLIINFPAPIYAWDQLAYRMGYCNSMPFEQVVQMNDAIEKLETEKNPLEYTEEDKKMIESKPWKVFVLMAKGAAPFQTATEPCKKLNLYHNALEKFKGGGDEEFNQAKSEIEELKKQLEQGGFGTKILLQLKDATEASFTTGTVDTIWDLNIYAVQAALNHFIGQKRPTETKITEYGYMDDTTKDAILLFKEYSGLISPSQISNYVEDEKITNDFLTKLKDYITVNASSIVDPKVIDYSSEDMQKSSYEEIYKKYDVLKGLSSEPPKDTTIYQEYYAKKMDELTPDQKKEVINDSEDGMDDSWLDDMYKRWGGGKQ